MSTASTGNGAIVTLKTCKAQAIALDALTTIATAFRALHLLSGVITESSDRLHLRDFACNSGSGSRGSK
jgi:hypothetical protein